MRIQAISKKLKKSKKDDYFVSDDFKEVSKRFLWGCIEMLMESTSVPRGGCRQIP